MLVNVKDIHYDIDMNYFNYVINKKNVNYVIIKVYLLFDGQLLNYEEKSVTLSPWLSDKDP